MNFPRPRVHPRKMGGATTTTTMIRCISAARPENKGNKLFPVAANSLHFHEKVSVGSVTGQTSAVNLLPSDFHLQPMWHILSCQDRALGCSAEPAIMLASSSSSLSSLFTHRSSPASVFCFRKNFVHFRPVVKQPVQPRIPAKAAPARRDIKDRRVTKVKKSSKIRDEGDSFVFYEKKKTCQDHWFCGFGFFLLFLKHFFFLSLQKGVFRLP